VSILNNAIKLYLHYYITTFSRFLNPNSGSLFMSLREENKFVYQFLLVIIVRVRMCYTVCHIWGNH